MNVVTREREIIFRQVIPENSVIFTWAGKSAIPPHKFPVKMQIYRFFPTTDWEDIPGAINDSANANVIFTLTGKIDDLIPYKGFKTDKDAIAMKICYSKPQGLKASLKTFWHHIIELM